MAPEVKLAIHLSSLEKEGWDVEECVAWTNRLGIQFVEAGAAVRGEWGDAAELRRLLESYKLTLEAVDAAGEIAELEPQLRWAAEAGCRQVVVARVDMDQAPRMAEMAERLKMAINVDLCGGAARVEEVREILEKIDSPWMRAAIDTGHAFSAGCDPLELAAAFEGRVGHFRIRTGGREAVPLRSAIDLLLDGDYRGGIGILEESGRARALAARVEEVRRALELTIHNSR